MTTITAPRVLTSGLRGSIRRDAAIVAVSTLVIAASAQIAVRLPFSPVPITGQTLAVLLAGAALGPTLAIASTSLYLALALAGLPVLAPAADGTHLTGGAVLGSPTLGYVVGFLLASLAVGALAERGLTRSVRGTVLAMVVGNGIIYALGLSWLHHTLGTSLVTTVTLGLTPFLVGDALKIAVAAGLLPSVWRLVR